MKAQEIKGRSILQREFGNVYGGQSFEALKSYDNFAGFYLKTCHTENVELKSSVFVELLLLDAQILASPKLADNPYNYITKGHYYNGYYYTGFTSVYVSAAIRYNINLVPSVILELTNADKKYGTTIEAILSRTSTGLMSINGGEFLNGLLEKCSNSFVELWKAWLNSFYRKLTSQLIRCPF